MKTKINVKLLAVCIAIPLLVGGISALLTRGSMETFETLVRFYRISKPAGVLLVPYLLWVTFAGYLNFAIWLLN